MTYSDIQRQDIEWSNDTTLHFNAIVAYSIISSKKTGKTGSRLELRKQ